jgi:His Kinase A (phospho-acceptor) domain
MMEARRRNHGSASRPGRLADDGSLLSAFSQTLSAFWASSGHDAGRDPRAGALRSHVAGRMSPELSNGLASSRGAVASLARSATDLERMLPPARVAMLGSLVIAAAVMAVGLDLTYWLYAPDFDTAGQIDVPEQMLLVVLVAAAVMLLLQQSGLRQLMEQADSQAIDHGRPEMADLQEELSEGRAELAYLRSRVAELEARRVLPSDSTDDRLALIGHDLRTPLNAVIGFADLMAQEVYGPIGHPKYREYARHVRDSGRALLEVAHNVMAIRDDAMSGPSAGPAQGRRATASPVYRSSMPSAAVASPALSQTAAGSAGADVEQAITRSLAGLRRTAADLSAADRPASRPFGKRSVA